MRSIDSISLKYITAQASLNKMIALNKQLLSQVEVLTQMNKDIREYNNKTQ